MANQQCLVKAGSYNINESSPYAEVGALYRFTPKGTTWVVLKPIGSSKVFLKCTSNDGKAATEFITGLPWDGVSPYEAPVLAEAQAGDQFFNRSMKATGASPMIEYLYDNSNDFIYKIITVLSDNLFEIESANSLSDGDGVSLQWAYYCKSNPIRSIDLYIADGVTVNVNNVNGLMTYRGPLAETLHFNVNDGPQFINGNTTIRLHQDASLQRLS